MARKTKKCRICGERKDVSQFNDHPSYRDGLDKRCKQCVIDDKRERRREQRQEWKEVIETHDPCQGTSAKDACKFLADCQHNMAWNYTHPENQKEPYCFLAHPMSHLFINAYRRANGSDGNRARKAIAQKLVEERTKRKYAANRKSKRQEEMVTA